MANSGASVVIVGGGIIGTASAFYLSKAGFEVTLIDQGKIGQECSRGNCGMICPSHVLPLAAPGAIRKTIGSLFRKKSPFYIKPRLDWNLISWLLSFAKRCNRQDMLRSGVGIHQLLQHSRMLYQQLITEENLDCDWQTKGLLFVYHSEKELEEYAHTDQLLREQFGVAATRYDRAGLQRLEPTFLPEVAGAWLYEGDAHLRPDLLMQVWRKKLVDNGVRILEECRFESLQTEHQRATAIQTSQGELKADHFLFALGAISPRFNDIFGCKLPIQPGKGYSVTMSRPAKCPQIPMIFEEHRVAVTPFADGYRIGSTMEFVGYDNRINRPRLEYLLESTKLYLQDPLGTATEEEWFGWRPMTYDGLPILDRTPKYRNTWIAAGHGMLGLSMATGTGQLMTELIAERSPSIDPKPYALAGR